MPKGNKRKRSQRIYRAHDSTLPLVLRTNEARIVRPLSFFTNINSDGSGNTINYQDVGTLLSSATEWSSIIGLFRFYKILKVTVQMVPIIKMSAEENLSAVNHFEYPALALGYNPNTYGVPSSIGAVLTLPASFISVCNRIETLSFKPVYTGGETVGPLDVAKIASGQWGAIQYYGNAFDLSLPAWYIRVIFLVEFTRQA